MRDFLFYVRDILTAIESIESFVDGMEYEAFRKDDKTVSAVIRKLEVIGEAVKQLPDDFRTKHPDIPWKQIAGMRDKLIHFYFGVDPLIVWQTILNRLPVLREAMQNALDSSRSDA